MCRGVNGVVTAMCTPTFSCRGGFSLAATEGCTGLGMASGVVGSGEMASGSMAAIAEAAGADAAGRRRGCLNFRRTFFFLTSSTPLAIFISLIN